MGSAGELQAGHRSPSAPANSIPFKGEIIRLLAQHDYSAQQIFQQLKERGYQGRYTILKAFVRQVRPKPRPAFLTLHFEPGECAQVDWGCAGSVPVGSTRRRLSFFLMVLAFSRKLYLEFTLAETLEHFLCLPPARLRILRRGRAPGLGRQLQGGRPEPGGRLAGVQPPLPGFRQPLRLPNPGLWRGPAAGKRTRRKRRGLCQKELPQRPGAVGFSTRQSGGPLLAGHGGQCPGSRPDPQNAPGTLRPGKAQAPASAALRGGRAGNRPGQQPVPHQGRWQPLLGSLPVCLQPAHLETLPRPAPGL